MKKDNPSKSAVSSDDLLVPERRKFLANLGKTTVAAAVVGAAMPFLEERSSVVAQSRGINNSFYQQRALASYQFRVAAAKLAIDLALPNERAGKNVLSLPDNEVTRVRRLFELQAVT